MNDHPYSQPCPCEWMDSNDNLFLLYTSGSSGVPKGLVHSTAGYLLYATVTAALAFDLRQGDLFAAVVDVGLACLNYHCQCSNLSFQMDYWAYICCIRPTLIGLYHVPVSRNPDVPHPIQILGNVPKAQVHTFLHFSSCHSFADEIWKRASEVT